MIVDSSFYCLAPRVVDSIEISYWFFAKKGRVFWDFHGETAATRTRTRTRESRGSRRGARDIGRSEIRHRARLRFCRGYVKWRSYSGGVLERRDRSCRTRRRLNRSARDDLVHQIRHVLGNTNDARGRRERINAWTSLEAHPVRELVNE